MGKTRVELLEMRLKRCNSKFCAQLNMSTAFFFSSCKRAALCEVSFHEKRARCVNHFKYTQEDISQSQFQGAHSAKIDVQHVDCAR